ncbi:MAG: SDR family NAD(P)-dependent oxidoreductase [Armatimonadetes bacterium]|nr:SDR family NAD(P)-dependent oxidoreductase [Candidatus Hippobium faecium]
MNIIITGATGKIGSLLAENYGKTDNLILQYFSNEKKMSDIISNIQRFGNRYFSIKWDLAENYSDFVTKSKQIFIPDVLINCFSTYRENTFSDFRPHEFEKDIVSNALSPLWLTKEFAKINPKITVINMLDIRTLMRDEKHFTYSMSKYLFAHLTEESAFYLAPCRVCGIALGLNETDKITDPSSLPIKEKTTFEDIKNTIDYIIENKHITGEIISLDSGRHLRI